MGAGTPGGTHVRDFPAPRDLAQRARDRSGPEVVSRPAATVLLVRDADAGRAGVEVFLIRRVSSMAFAPSVWVFPGGGVDERDARPGVPWAGPGPQAWSERTGLDAPAAQAVVVAAVREVFEECGVLLAGPDEHTLVGDVRDGAWQRDRAALVAKELSFAELLERRGLVVRSDLLALCDHWVTPACEPRRYDTFFFAAVLPQGQVPDGSTTEADRSGWVAPGELLAQAEAGRARLMPPTVVNLERVAAAGCARDLLTQPAEVLTVCPQPVEEGGRVLLRAVLPGAAPTRPGAS